jgi:hypothetical protein
VLKELCCAWVVKHNDFGFDGTEFGMVGAALGGGF